MRAIALCVLFCLVSLSHCHDIDFTKTIKSKIGARTHIIGYNVIPSNTSYYISPTATPKTVTTTLQRAIYDLGSEGGTIYITTGIYTLINSLIIPSSNTHLAGTGMEDTILKLADYAEPFAYDKTRAGFIRTRLTNNIIISNITLDGNKNNQYHDEDHLYGRFGIFTEASDYVWFDYVKVKDWQGYGFDPHGWKDGNIWGNHLTITNCVSNENDWDGFTLDQTLNITVINCTAIHNGRHGFNIVTGSRFITLSNNTAIDNGYYDSHGGKGCGFMIQNNRFFGTRNAELYNNIAINNLKAGICLDDSPNIYLYNNFVNYTKYCFHIVNGQSSLVENNQCYTKYLVNPVNTTIIYNTSIITQDVSFMNNLFIETDCPFCSNTNTKDESSYTYLTQLDTYIPFGIAFYRWGMFILLKVFPAMWYRQLKFKKKQDNPALVEKGEYIDNNDVTVVISVYKPPARFENTLKSILSHKPNKLLVVSSMEGIEKVRATCAKFPEVTLYEANVFDKRSKLVVGIKQVKTKIVILTDDDVDWTSPSFLEKLVAPFQHNKKIGGVGCRQVGKIDGFCDIWGIMADMRLAVRMLELMATTWLDKGAPCISGRTAAYRTNILQCEEFYDYLQNEHFMGKLLLSGDDKCITRFVTNHGHLIYHQLRDNCELITTFETGWAFFEQLKRWSRNTWRSDITSVFIERKIWRVNPWTALILVDKMMTPFFMMYGISYLPYKLAQRQHWTLFVSWFIWILFSRFLKLMYYFADKKKWKYVVYLPLFVLFQYIQAAIKIWALFTLKERKWGSKPMTIKGNKIVINNDVIKSKNYDDEKKEKSLELTKPI
jgi:parallel beta-helix repeat protein